MYNRSGGSIYETVYLHIKKDNQDYIYFADISKTPSSKEFVIDCVCKFIRYSINDDTVEEIGQIAYESYITGEGVYHPSSNWHNYEVELYFDICDGYLYFVNPDPEEYGNIYRMATDGSGQTELVTIR